MVFSIGTSGSGSLEDTTIANFAELAAAANNTGGLGASSSTSIKAFLIDLAGNTGALGTGKYLVINNNDSQMTSADLMVAWAGTSQEPVGGTDFIFA